MRIAQALKLRLAIIRYVCRPSCNLLLVPFDSVVLLPFYRKCKMLLRFSVCTVLCAIILAVYYRPQPQSPTQFNVRGTRNKTALFIVTEHHGYSNVHLATAQSILERYPDIQIHFASFPALSSKIADISSATKRRQPLARDVVFHHLHGRSYMEAILQELKLIGLGIRDDGSAGTLAKPGIEGLDKLAQIMEYAFSPWTPEEQLAIHDQITSIIAEIDPATIVLDTIFSPAIEATRGRNRSHVIITPNTLSDTFVALQPYGGMFGSIPRKVISPFSRFYVSVVAN